VQQFQILDNKDEIRYDNGYDIHRVIDNEKLPNVNKIRNYFEFGIGSRVYLDSYFLGINIKYGLPLESTINDSDWKQHYILIGFEIGF
jgi:hypothetical protein